VVKFWKILDEFNQNKYVEELDAERIYSTERKFFDLMMLKSTLKSQRKIKQRNAINDNCNKLTNIQVDLLRLKFKKKRLFIGLQ